MVRFFNDNGVNIKTGKQLHKAAQTYQKKDYSSRLWRDLFPDEPKPTNLDPFKATICKCAKMAGHLLNLPSVSYTKFGVNLI